MCTSRPSAGAIRRRMGRRILMLREQQGLSQQFFSVMVGMDRSYLIDIEQGKRNVSLSYLLRIAQGLDVTLSELFEGVDS